ncbi:hypothetical protein DYB28_006055, partial [Aphanomyces astaci]
MADLTNAQRQLVANARARKQGRALSLKLKDQAEAERHQHLADKRQKAQQNQKPAVDNKLAIRYVTKDLAQYALHSDWKKKRHRKDKTRASTDQLTQLQAAKEEKQKQMSAEINRMVADAHEKRERQKKAKMQAELREAALEAERLRLEEDKRLKALQVEQVKNMATPMGVLVAKRVEKLRLQEYENEMTQAYQKRLAAQELARKADLQKTYERQEKRVSMALLNVVSPEEKVRQDEVRAAVVQAAERKKEEARLEEKRRKQRQLDAEQGQELRK